MSLSVVELNDHSLKVGNAEGLLLQSPGFALVEGSGLKLGETAEAANRVSPINSYNKYWLDLSLDPLNHDNHLRHSADIAHAHLLHLAEQSDAGEQAIFAIPGNFTAQQLSILLGVAQHSPWKPVGLVDSALAASAWHVANASGSRQAALVHLDLQLHQVVVTRLEQNQDRLAVAAVVQIPGVGSQNLVASLLQAASDAFIQQCRFNPQHSAVHEQALYDALMAWLRGEKVIDDTLVLELKTPTASHTAKLPRESLTKLLRRHYQKLIEQLTAFIPAGDTGIVLAEPLARLPALADSLDSLGELIRIPAGAGIAGALDFHGLIRRDPGSLELVKALTIAAATKVAPVPVAGETTIARPSPPTHVLGGSRAIAAAGVVLRHNSSLNGEIRYADGLIEISTSGDDRELGRFEQRQDRLLFEGSNYELNGKSAAGTSELSLGDQLSFPGSEQRFSLIEVSDGR